LFFHIYDIDLHFSDGKITDYFSHRNSRKISIFAFLQDSRNQTLLTILKSKK